MYTFRFNPVFSRWVMLGTPLPSAIRIPSGGIILGSRDPEFLCATYPRQPFVLDPADREKPISKEGLFVDQPAVGEYELVLYQGKKDIFDWSADEWSRWISTIQGRLVQLHHNPYLHHAFLALDTAAAKSVEKYIRAGEIIATSHPVSGEISALTSDMAAKILAKESLYVVAEDDYGHLRAPSAPLHPYELWYIPTQYKAGFEAVTSKERGALSKTLAHAFKRLHDEFPKLNFTVRIHTSLLGESGSTWWLQIYVSSGQTMLPVVPFPEKLVRDFKLGKTR